MDGILHTRIPDDLLERLAFVTFIAIQKNRENMSGMYELYMDMAKETSNVSRLSAEAEHLSSVATVEWGNYTKIRPTKSYK